MTLVTKDSGGLVTSIENNDVRVTAYFFELKGLSTLEISGATSRDNGTTAYTQTLTLSLKPSGSTPAIADSRCRTIRHLNQRSLESNCLGSKQRIYLIG
jgi:hypothetical protein